MRRRSHRMSWKKKVLVPLGVLFVAVAIAGTVAGKLGGRRLQLGAAALQPQTGTEGALLGDLRRRRQPDRLHPRQQHPPAGLLERRCRRTSSTRRSRSRIATSSTTARSTRPGSPAPPGRTCWPAASRCRAPRRSPSSSSATSTSVTPKRRSSARSIEAHLAYEEEEAHSKSWILTAYLNTAPYGTVEGETAVGAEAAAQTYYGKPARELDLTEAAMIAGLPQAPSEYNPFLDPQAAPRAPQRGAGSDGGPGLHHRLRIPRRDPRRPRPQPRPQVPGDPRPLPLRPRPAGADRQIRPQHGPLRRPQGLHDDRPRTAGTGAGSGRLVLGLLHRRRPGRRPRLGRPLQRRDRRPRLDRRLRQRKPVQLRLAGAPPARLLVQDLRPDHRDQAGHRPLHHLLRRHLAEDAGPARRRHLDRQQRRARRRHDGALRPRPGTRSTSSSPSSTSTSGPKT